MYILHIEKHLKHYPVRFKKGKRVWTVWSYMWHDFI